MSRFIMPRQGVKGQNLSPADGAKLYFKVIGQGIGGTDKNIYTNEALSVAATNPVIADSKGLFEELWQGGDYDVFLRDKNNVLLWGPETIRNIVQSTDNKITPLTVSVMVNDNRFSIDDIGKSVPTTKEFTASNGGGGTYDVVLTSGVTPNTFNIIIGVADPIISFVLRVEGTYNVAQYGASGGGVTDGSGAIGQAIIDWRIKILAGKKVKLFFPDGTYISSGLVFNFSGLGTAVSSIVGENSRVEFDSLGNKPAMIDLSDTKDLSFYDIRFDYPGVFDRPAAECPFVGLLFARNAANDFSGRHTLFNCFVTGTFQLATFYNAGTEENNYYHPEFRNGLLGRRAAVITCSNHLGATSEFLTITTTAISTTLNTFISPSFYTDGEAREAVSIRGAGGLTMINPYSSHAGFAHYAIQAEDQSCSSIRILGYQAEVGRGSVALNADYVFRHEGVNTLDISGCEFTEQFSTTDIAEHALDGVRNFKRNTINTAGKVVTIDTTTEVSGCEIIAASGIDLTNVTNVIANDMYVDLKANLVLPNNTKGGTIRAKDIDAPVIIGKVKQRSTAASFNLDEGTMGMSGSGTITDFTGDFGGLPYLAQTRYAFCVSQTLTIEHGTGNIVTNTGADIVLTANQYIEITYIGNSNKFYTRLMG